MRFYAGIILLTLTAISCTAAGAQHKIHGFTKHYDESLFKVTKNGIFSVELVEKEHELKTGVNIVDLIIHDKNDRDVTGADITVTPWMPEMGHGVFEKPVVTERGGGLYTVENINLIMAARWELRVTVKDGAMEDSAVFDFPDVKAVSGHDHKMKISAEFPDPDLTVIKLSENKVFRVSYKSRVEPVPVNKIHVWTLNIQNPDGSPVSRAEVLIDGDMPEHGHGMPTKPEVTDDLGEGAYTVEGIKFSMPGWWVVKFNIKAADREDIVMFNLLVKE